MSHKPAPRQNVNPLEYEPVAFSYKLYQLSYIYQLLAISYQLLATTSVVGSLYMWLHVWAYYCDTLTCTQSRELDYS